MNLLLLVIALLLAGCFYHLFCISIELQELNETMNITDRRMKELLDREMDIVNRRLQKLRDRDSE